jgi:tetratricopeptide (TPR) repeat protein
MFAIAGPNLTMRADGKQTVDPLAGDSLTDGSQGESPTGHAPDPFDRVLALIIEAPQRSGAMPLPGAEAASHDPVLRNLRRLGKLLHELGQPHPPRPVAEVEDLIWALWISHPSKAAEALMTRGIEAFADGRLAQARGHFDALVAAWPDWAEAWNKRATLAYVEGRDHEACRDIARTLALEPRHFGAIAGFGQICLRRGRPCEAAIAFRAALALNPHLHGIRALLDEISGGATRMH